MTTIAEIRQKFPKAYTGLSDQQLADSIYKQYYPNMDRRSFDAQVGLKPYQNIGESLSAAVKNVPVNWAIEARTVQRGLAEASTTKLEAAFNDKTTITPTDVQAGPYARELIQWGMQQVDPKLTYLKTGQYQERLKQIADLVNTPKGRASFLLPQAKIAATDSLRAQLQVAQQRKNLTPVDVAKGSLEYFLSGATGAMGDIMPGLALSVIMGGNPAPAVGLISAQIAGTSYQGAREQGLNPERAAQYAKWSAAAQSIPLLLPIGMILRPGSTILGSIFKDAAAGGLMVGIANILQAGIDKGLLTPDMTWGQARDKLLAGGELANATIIGAIVGGTLGGIVHGAKAGVNTARDAYKGIFPAQQKTMSEVFPAPKSLQAAQSIQAPMIEKGSMLERVNKALQERGFEPVKPPEAPAIVQLPTEVPANVAPAPQNTTSGIVEKIIQVESGGNAGAKNPNSSAGGLGQFIDSTWLATVRKHAPEFADLTNKEVLALKTDTTPAGVKFQTRMLEALTSENTKGLLDSGIEATPGNTYLAHFLGLEGAKSLLAKVDQLPVSDVVSGAVIDENPFMRTMTVGDLKQWAANKMGGAKGTATSTKPNRVTAKGETVPGPENVTLAPKIVVPKIPKPTLSVQKPIPPAVAKGPTISTKLGDVVDTRNTGVRFHGGGTTIGKLYADEGQAHTNDYGTGFYTTDAADIALGYAGAKKPNPPILYRVTETGKIKPFDMEKPVPEWLVKANPDVKEAFNSLVESGVSKPNTREIYDEIRTNAAADRIPAQETLDILDGIRANLEARGFNALDHRGGLRTGRLEHKVRIYFNPDTQIRIKNVGVSAYLGKIINRPKQTGGSKTVEVNLSNARRTKGKNTTKGKWTATARSGDKTAQGFGETPDAARKDAVARLTLPKGTTVNYTGRAPKPKEVTQDQKNHATKTIADKSPKQVEAAKPKQVTIEQTKPSPVKVAPSPKNAANETYGLANDQPMTNYIPSYALKGTPLRPDNGLVPVAGKDVKIPTLDKPQRREEITSMVEGIIGSRLYVGKIRNKSTLGLYKRRNAEVRTQAYNAVEVLAHELAHFLDMHYSMKQRFHALWKNNPALRKIMEGFSYTSVPDKITSEGFAEFVRLWLTNYPAVMARAPTLVKAFEKILGQDKVLNRRMRNLQAAMHRWFFQGPEAQLRAASGKKLSPLQTIKKFLRSYPLERTRQQSIDRIHAAKVVDRTLGVDTHDATKSSFILFQMINGAESTYSTIIEFGTITKVPDGYGFNGKGLQEVFRRITKHGYRHFDLFMDYLLAQHSANLMKQGKEHLLTAEQIKAGLAYGEKYPEFKDTAKEWMAFNNRMLDWYVQMGLITKDQKEAFQRLGTYVPLYRVIEQIANGGGAGRGSSIGARLFGSSANTKDIAANIIENLNSNVRAALIARAKSNLFEAIISHEDGALFASKIPPDSKLIKLRIEDQARRIATVMEEMGMSLSEDGVIISQRKNSVNPAFEISKIRAILEKNPSLLEAWLVNVPPQTDGSTYVDSAIIDGKRIYMEIREPLIIDMLTGLTKVKVGKILKALFSTKTFITRTITSALQFMVRNITKDTVTAYAMSKNKFIPVYTTLVGMYHTIAKTKQFQEFMLNGGGYGGLIEANTAETRSRRQLDLPARNMWDVAAKMLAGYDRFASAFELGSRVGDAVLGRKAGKGVLQTAWEGRDLTTDFSLIGRNDVWSSFLRTVPFAGAAIAGIDKTARAIAEIKGKMTLKNLVVIDKRKAVFLVKGSVLTAATLALWLLNKDDPRYQGLTKDEKSQYWWIWIPGQPKPIKILRPYDVGYLFASIPEAMFDYISNKDGAAVAGQLAWMALNTSPVNGWPGLIQPYIEQQANKNWRGAPIVPEYMKNRDPSYQYTSRTPQMFRALGKALGVSPLIAEHYAKGFFNYFEQYLADGTDALFWNEKDWGPRPFALNPTDYVTDQFTGRAVPYRTKWTEGYYELRNRAQGMQSAFTALRAEAVYNKAPLTGFLDNSTSMTLAALSPLFSAVDRMLAKDREIVMNITYDKNLTRAQKETQINGIYAQRNTLMGQQYKEISSMLNGLDVKR